MLKRCKAPIHGVFAVHVAVDGTKFNGVANIGTRPTLNGVRNQLEVHIFDMSADLYGKPMTVFPVAKIRDEQKFDSFEILKAQIQADAAKARLLLE
jgi:riboflavin kinase/FMN adenylyltransferase